MDLPLTALGLGAVLVFSALFSTAEALLNKITKGEVKETIEEGGSGAEAITALLQNPRNFLNTIMVAKGFLAVAVVIITIFFSIQKQSHPHELSKSQGSSESVLTMKSW